MKFLAIEIEKKDAERERFQMHLKDESIKVLELYERGFIREIYFDPFHCAILIIECNSLLEVQEELSKLPLASNGLIHFRIIELNPYTGFSRLLK